MDDIKFEAIFRKEYKTIEPSKPMGCGEVIFLYINRYYYGRFMHKSDGWCYIDSSLEQIEIDFFKRVIAKNERLKNKRPED